LQKQTCTVGPAAAVAAGVLHVLLHARRVMSTFVMDGVVCWTVKHAQDTR
jgi:hypothetical protein